MGAGPGGGWRWAQLAVHSQSAPERSRAAPQPFGLKAPQAAVPASRGPAWRWGGAPPFPSPPSRGPIPQIPLTRTLRIPLGQGLAWPLLSLTTLGGGACCPRPPPGSAGGNCGVLQGGRTVRGACTRRGSFGTGRGQGQEPEGLGGPARHHLTFSSRKGRPQPSAQGPSPWAASRPARSRS